MKRERHGADRVGRRTPEYSTWVHMKDRCTNPNNDKYSYYGGRGITVCPEWQASFITFLRDMGPRPVGQTLDRADNSGNYNPDNCRWASKSVQMRNKRKWGGWRGLDNEVLTLTEIANELAMPLPSLRTKLIDAGVFEPNIH